MVDDMDYELKLPSVGELTFPQWRDWLVRYNKFIGERDVEHAAKLRERDDRIEKLEAALREIIGALDDPKGGQHVYDMRNASYIARKALEGKDG